MEIQNGINSFIDHVNELHSRTTTSLPAATKPFILSSPVFIQESVFMSSTEEVNNILSSIYDVYVGYVLLALKLDFTVGNGRKVKDIFSQVSTGTPMSGTASAPSIFSSETFAGNILTGNPNKYAEIDDIAASFSNEVPKVKVTLAKEDQYVQSDVTKPLVSGRLITIDLLGGDSQKDQKFPVTLMLRLEPRVFPDSIVGMIIKSQIKPDIRARYFQYLAGEISFIKDFILQLDLLKEREHALKEDKSNTIYELLKKKNAGFLKKIGKLAGIIRSHNFKDATFIFNKNSLEKAASDAGISFKNFVSRQKFFDTTYSMFALSVDPDYGMVDFYIDGTPKPGTYSFKQLETKSKKGDIDILEIIKALQSGNANVRSI